MVCIHRWASGTVANAPFECSSTRRMVWKGCWKHTPPPLLHGNKCARIICRSVFHHDNTDIVVMVMVGGTSACQTFHQCWSIRIQQTSIKKKITVFCTAPHEPRVRCKGWGVSSPKNSIEENMTPFPQDLGVLRSRFLPVKKEISLPLGQHSVIFYLTAN